MYLLHGTTLTLVWFLAVNIAASAAAVMLASWRGVDPGATESRLLWLRLLPATASALFVALVFIPSYVKFEPRETEGLDITLTLAAAAACVVIAIAVARGAIGWWRALDRARAWTKAAEPIALDGVGIPAFRVESDQPILALVGIVRSRLFIARSLIDALTAEELAASVKHEVVHDLGWDNLKRLAMRGAPDLFGWTRTARRLEHAWAAAAEQTADASAFVDRSTRLALASALVKVARQMPPVPGRCEPISTLTGAGEISSRVRRLIEDAPPPRRAAGRSSRARAALIVAAGVSLAFAYAPLLETVHRATEVLVNGLP